MCLDLLGGYILDVNNQVIKPAACKDVNFNDNKLWSINSID